MTPGGRYEFLTPTEHERVEAGLSQMRDILTRNAGRDDLQMADKIALFNTQEQVNGILTHSDRNRLVCEHHAPVGSHRQVTSCEPLWKVMERENDVKRKMYQATIWQRDKCTLSPGAAVGCGPRRHKVGGN
jgi:hypothetical protein